MKIDASILETIAKLYKTTPHSLIPLPGGHFSFVYEYHINKCPYILRITPPNDDINLRSMQSALTWMAFLARHNGPVTRPIPSCNGKLIERIAKGHRVYLAVSFEKASGELAEGMALSNWNDELFQELGRTLGKTHRIAQTYIPPSSEFLRLNWDEPTNCFNPISALVDAESFILEKRDQILKSVGSLPREKGDYGLTHLDLHFGNFFVDLARKKITFFDFDDCGYGWYAMDIAMLLFDVLVVYGGSQPERFGERFLQNLLLGYRREKAFNSFWVKQLPNFLKLVEIGVYAMLYRTYDPASADEWVKKFMPGRKERIEQEIAYVNLNFDEISRMSDL